MNNKQFSVVMSVYKNDRKEFLSEALNSLLNQTLLPSEIIIVIDGFVDSKIKELLENKRKTAITKIKIIRLKENKGLANALNIAINNTSYDIIARMDADDICFENRFEKQIPYLINNDIDILGGQIIEFGKDTKDIFSEKKVPLTHKDIIKVMKIKSPFTHPTIVFKKSVFNDLNGYDTTIFPEDYDFFVRANLKGHIFANISDAILWFRVGNNRNEVLKRRHGFKYAKNEFFLYKKFLNIGYYSAFDFIKVSLIKIPLRILPFKLFKLLYYNFFRKI